MSDKAKILTKVCAWCGASLGDSVTAASVQSDTVHEKPVETTDSAKKSANQNALSHGICNSCMEGFLKGSGRPLMELLEESAPPVVVVDSQRRVIGANQSAQQMLGKEESEFHSKLGGEVFDCHHASKPGGCGKQLHCEFCVIRRSVMHTHETGEPVSKTPATLLQGQTNPQDIRFEISTWKAGEVVFLQIDDILQ